MSACDRDAFEAAYLAEQLRRCGEGFRSTVLHQLSERKPDGDYLHYLDSMAWTMWQAARQAPLADDQLADVLQGMQKLSSDLGGARGHSHLGKWARAARLSLDAGFEAITALFFDRASVLAQNEALHPDAKAYRFLRDQAVSARASCGDVPMVRRGLGEVLHGKALDQAVASALEKHG
ncbi:MULTISPECIES: hypothetical protein [unclassified Pseudomonas]|uniref:hypothetical protein n=1 Tax=unclassified Pseudomonas TaxID=196821 RepID=UPI000A1F530D|nr:MULTISPECIES: hypothetical protein [unclassified Pseudomonas]